MTRHSVATAWFARSADTKANFVTRSPWRKKPPPCGGSPPPLRAASPRASIAAFPLVRLAHGQCLGRAGRQVLGAPLAELPGTNAKLRRHLRQPLVAVQQPLHRLRLELPREAPSGSPLRHPSLLGRLGSLANPPVPGGKSSLSS